MLLLLLACHTNDDGVVPDTDTGTPDPGTPADLVLTVSQDLWDAVPLGCNWVAPASVRNDGAVDHTISEITLGGTAITWSGPTLPVTLAPGERFDFSLTYAPIAVEVVADTLTVATDAGVLTEALDATAVSMGTGADAFTAAPLRPVDIVVTLDQSESMYNDPYVADELALLPEQLDLLGQHWRLAVIGVDGCIQGRDWLDPGDPERYAGEVEDMVDPEAAEHGFTQLEAMVAELDGGCVDGLLREGAALAVVGVTDEVEQSPNGWEFYVELFQGLVDEPAHLRVHAVAGDYPNGCDTAQPGIGWYEASVATNGSFRSVCSDEYAVDLAAGIAAGARGADGFVLSEEPVEATIAVTVDGAAVTTFTYDLVANAVVFDLGTEPAAGAAVEVTYEIQGTCEE